MNQQQQGPKAHITKQRKVSTVWLIPLVALLMGGWMLYEYISRSGPEITLVMKDASSIEVGKTLIKSRNVKVGVVTDVKLSEGYDHIVLKATMDKDAERMLKEDTLFWVVKPRIGKEGITGLDTLLSGSYIEIQPGQAPTPKFEYKVLDLPPVAPPDAKGLRVILAHDKAGKLSVGDPVIYQGFTAGRVELVHFDVERNKALYQLFIFEPYDDLIRSGTFFWISSGIDFQLNADGLTVRLDSVESLLGGGVSFGVPEGEKPGDPIKMQMSQFTLYDSQQDVTEGLYSQYLEYVMNFDESVRGLVAGAPVEYRGLRVGTVSQIPFTKSSMGSAFRTSDISVLIRIEPKRLFNDGEEITVEGLREALSKEFKLGLRGSLKTASLLTGALYIDVDYDDAVPDYEPTFFNGYEIFPSKQGEFAEVQNLVMSMLEKVNQLPINETIESANRSLQTLDRTLLSAQQAVNSIEQWVEQQSVQSIPEEMEKSLQQLQEVLDGFGTHSTLYQNLDDNLIQIESMVSELEPLIEKVNEKPNSLIFGDDNTPDPIPVKGTD